MVGRLAPWKGQHVFLKAAAAVKHRFSNRRFQIIGEACFTIIRMSPSCASWPNRLA